MEDNKDSLEDIDEKEAREILEKLFKAIKALSHGNEIILHLPLMTQSCYGMLMAKGFV